MEAELNWIKPWNFSQCPWGGWRRYPPPLKRLMSDILCELEADQSGQQSYLIHRWELLTTSPWESGLCNLWALRTHDVRTKLKLEGIRLCLERQVQCSMQCHDIASCEALAVFVKSIKEAVHHVIFVRSILYISTRPAHWSLSFDLLNFSPNAVLALLTQPCPEGFQPLKA